MSVQLFYHSLPVHIYLITTPVTHTFYTYKMKIHISQNQTYGCPIFLIIHCHYIYISNHHTSETYLYTYKMKIHISQNQTCECPICVIVARIRELYILYESAGGWTHSKFTQFEHLAYTIMGFPYTFNSIK